jgi:uncharacterized protein
VENIFREFQIFVKPVSSSCNLNCRYCYYLDKNNLYPDTHRFLMQDDILEKYIEQNIIASTDDIITFSWHGGEPLLAGLDFFRKIIRLQSAHQPAGRTIVNGIQTNGTLIDDRWSRFFADHHIMVGLSLDGPEVFHDLFRRTGHDSSTWTQVMKGFHHLKRHGVNPEILCVVNSENVKHPHVIYNFFRQLGIKYLTFLPLVEYDAASPECVSSNSVPAEEFGYFLSEIFDEWVENDIGEIKIQIFEEAARKAFNQDHTLCIFKENCGGVPVIEHNGDFYSCDHYVDKDHLLGNIQDKSLAYFLDSEIQTQFGRAKSLSLPDDCIRCEVRSMCNGECPKNRFILTPEGRPGLNYLCKGYKYFFSHIRPFIEAIKIANQNTPS